MSVLADIHLAISVLLFVIVWIEGNDEPFWLRTLTAAIVGLFWLPMLILFIVFVVIDWIDGKLKARRK